MSVTDFNATDLSDDPTLEHQHHALGTDQACLSARFCGSSIDNIDD